MEDAVQSHKSPLQIHQENMKMLAVLPISGNRSTPNSPMMRRAAERAGKSPTSLSPCPQRKGFLQVSEESRSKSLTHLGDDLSSNQSPKESPVGSPSLSVSEKLIRTHFLSNTTGKAGSYLLKKSEDIIKNKSPSGSPRHSRSPNVTRKTTIRLTSSPPRSHDKSSTLMMSSSPGGTSMRTLDVPLEYHKVLVKKTNYSEDSDCNSDDEIDQHINGMRKSIGAALLAKTVSLEKIKNTAPPNLAENSTVKNDGNIARPLGKRGKERKVKPKRHKYAVYGDTGLSPGYLTPPREPRGSKDLSAEMEIWKREERTVFQDLDLVDEASNVDSNADQDVIDNPEKSEGPLGVFTMPPVFANVAHKPGVRDYSVPTENQGKTDDENWDEMKRCRYLRIHSDEDEEEDDNLSNELSSDDVSDDEN